MFASGRGRGEFSPAPRATATSGLVYILNMATLTVEKVLDEEGAPTRNIGADCTDTYLEKLSKEQLSCSPEKLAEILGVDAGEDIHEVLKQWKKSKEDECSYRYVVVQ